ncbi:hypothetical protein ACQR09_13240 [Bradyrhizobium oligotrophicum]|uniref:hypothetical protein n=1 Tax=Bradyrhizobium oligotrophicum TaxID=44255 RepID=UPI003EB7F646
MSFTATVIRVLIASPSDLIEERKVAINAVYEWNVQHAEAESIVLLPVAWETHATPRSNVRPQQAINEQLVDSSDVLLGMFWTKLGTSTGVAESGTIEEIERFIAAGKPVLLYFSNRPIDPGKIDARQHRRLKAFKESTYRTALHFNFETLDGLKQLVSRHLLSEVRSLKSRNTSSVAAPAPISAPVGETLQNEADASLVPDGSWDRDKFEFAMFRAINSKNDDQIRVIDKAYRKTDEYSKGDNASVWEAFIEWARIAFGKDGKLRVIQKLASTYPGCPRIQFFLASSHSRFGQHELAGDAYLAAMRALSDPELEAARAADAIEEFSKVNKAKKVSEALAELRRVVEQQSSLESVLVEAVQKIAEIEKMELLSIALLERCIELSPDDHATRFALAYKQSQIGNEAIALYHYLQIPTGDRNSVVWNNIGAASDQLDLPAKAVGAFKRAAAMGQTLAMSNLGSKLMNGGFVELAREQVKRAMECPEVHENVGHLVAKLSSIKENEEKRQDELIKSAANRLALFRELGRAAIHETPEIIPQQWQGPHCILMLDRLEDMITLKGRYETEGGLLSALVTGRAGAALQIPKSKYSISYTGRIRGRAIVGHVKRERDGATLVESAGEQKPVMMVLNEAGDEIKVVEQLDSESPTVHVLKRVSLLSNA